MYRLKRLKDNYENIVEHLSFIWKTLKVVFNKEEARKKFSEKAYLSVVSQALEIFQEQSVCMRNNDTEMVTF